LLRRRLYDRAVQDYEEALRLDPNNAQYFRNRGNAYRIAGDRDRAVADYRKALILKPDDATRKQIEGALKDLGLSG
jgi:tetratricopeptide (TPR) repeat protein